MFDRLGGLSARCPTPVASKPSRSVDPAALIALFATPCAIAAIAIALVPTRRSSDEVYRDGFRPSIEQPTFAQVPSVRSAPAVVRPAQRATPPRATAPVTNASRVATVASPANLAPITINRQASTASFSLSDFEYSWDEAAWRAWVDRYQAYYRALWARRQWAHIAPAMRRMSAVRAAMMDALQQQPGLDPSMLEAMNDCGPFACGPTSSAYVPPASSPSGSRASVQRDGARWSLSNAHTQLMIRPSERCDLRYTLANGTSRAVVFDTPQTDQDDSNSTSACEVRELSVRDGAALEVSWRTSRWTQRAIITLGDRATQAEATIARDRLTSDATGAHMLEFVNLSSSTREWTVGGRALALEPGGVLRVQAPAEETSRDAPARAVVVLAQPSVIPPSITSV